MLFIGLAVFAAFLLGLRVGFTVGHRNALGLRLGARGKRDPPRHGD
jgi:hypothetical protein